MIRTSAILLSAAVLLAACGKEETANNAAENAAEGPVNAAEPANEVTATPAAAAAGALTADFMVGKWSAMNEDCSSILEFRKDGSVVTPIGLGKWSVDGDKLAFEYDGAKMDPSTVKVLGPDRIEITKDSGGKEIQRRC